MSHSFPVVSVLGDRIISISENMLYLSYLSYWGLCVEFPYGCICRKNFFDKTETTDTTYITISKPGFRVKVTTKISSVWVNKGTPELALG